MSEIELKRIKADAKTLLAWEQDPIRFVKEVFDIDLLTWQCEALDSIVKHDRISIRSGHGVGKTALLSWIILWWITTKYPAKIACTAPTSHQLKDVLWPELAKWRDKMPDRMKSWSSITTDRLEYHDTHSFAVARTARKEQPEAFQGFHSENMLFLIDEASGVEEIIFEAGSGAMSTSGAKTIMSSNPTKLTGYFYDSFHKHRGYWHNIIVSCIGIPIVSKDYIEEMAEKYGKDSNIYRVRVLGQFPTEEDDTIIPLYLIEEAVNRDIEQTGKMVWGLDVARFGDDRSALSKRHGNKLIESIKFWRNKDLMQLCGLIKQDYDSTIDKLKPFEILVDVIGLGAGVVDRLRELGLPAIGINVAESATVSDRYNRLKDELWFKCKDWFQAKDCSLYDDENLIAELSLPKYTINSNGKFVVEGKKDLKKRGLQSPDLADSFILTFAAYYDRPVYKPITEIKMKKITTLNRQRRK